MSKDKEIEAMIAAAKAKGAMANDQGVPLLNQRPPIMHGIPVNGGLITIKELENMTERSFRELVLGIVVNLLGGIYVPPPAAENTAEDSTNTGENQEEAGPVNSAEGVGSTDLDPED